MNIDDITGVSAVDDYPVEDQHLAETLTDVGASIRIHRMYGADLLYVPELPGDGWVVYDNGVWRIDDDGAVMRIVQKVVNAYELDVSNLEAQVQSMLAALAPPDDIKAVEVHIKTVRAFIKKLGAMQTVRAVEAALRTRSGLRAQADDFDRDPWLIGTNDGMVVDLRTGKARRATRGDRIRRTVAVSYAPRAKAPLWEKFISEVTGGDTDLIAYLQRAFGYSITGMTNEQVFFLCTGNGNNGKSTLLSAIRRVMGEHAMVCPAESFTGRRDGQIPNDIARLAGARFVIATETRENAVLEEHMVKLLTGEDAVPVRFLNREFFEFEPRFSIWLATNHRPRVRGTDNGIWRRIKNIPFNVSFPKEQIDKALPSKLAAEAQGIFNWLIEGARLWAESGFGTEPASVTLSTTTYRTDQDIVGLFLEECCVKSVGEVTSASDLFARFSRWGRDNGEPLRSQRWLGLQIRRIEWIQPVKAPDGGRAYRGIRVADGLPRVGHWTMDRAES